MTPNTSIARSRTPATLLAGLIAVGSAGCADLPLGDDESFAEVLNSSEERPALPASLRVVTWNVKGALGSSDGEYLDGIAKVIRDSGADVVLLQEIHRGTRAAGEHDQFAELAERTGMNGCFGKSLDVGESGEYGNAILSRAPLASARRFRLPGRGEPRTLLRCESEWEGIEVPLLTTHLITWDRVNRGPRRAQVATIASELAADRDPLAILGGDFNAPVAAPEMLALREGTPVHPAFTSRVATHRSGMSYDHLFVGDRWTVAGATVLHRGTSDHWPVRVELRAPAPQEPTG